MEKKSESYEYLSSNSETNCDQFFIIEDDGTFLTYKPVQYVTHVQEDKSTLEDTQSQPSPIYDATSQQLLVSVANSNEHMLADSSVLPNGNFYCSNYFLQTEANTSDQVDNNVVSNLGRLNDMQIVETTAESKQNATEIMLTDEQYSLLEQKGWILLELNNKVFILDTTGLQDITNNHELIQQLKVEGQNDTQLYSRSTEENETSKAKLKIEINSQESSIPQSENKLEAEESLHKKSNSLNTDLMENNELEEITDIEVLETEKEILRDKLNNIQAHTFGDTIMIKTKLLLKDISDKIELGKTINGKKLVVKLVPKQRSGKTKFCENKPDSPKPKKPAPSRPMESSCPQPDANVSILPDWQFNSLVVYAQREMKCSEEHLAAAKHVVAQLLQVAAFQRAVAGKNLFITRAVKNKSANSLSETVTQNVVLGIISEIDGEQQFVHIPDMMLNLADTGDKDPHYVTHVHVMETKQQNATQTISISILRRPLPHTTAKSFRQSKVFACSTCASLFTSKKALLDHQDAHCLDAEDSLTIDTEEIVNIDEEPSKISPYCITETDKGIIYSCLKCPLKFNKLCNCRRHMKTHTRPTEIDNTDSEKTTEKTYKCKMCPSSYYYASTLSKHIVTAHINVNTGSVSN